LEKDLLEIMLLVMLAVAEEELVAVDQVQLHQVMVAQEELL
jgi:hypothetical protein